MPPFLRSKAKINHSFAPERRALSPSPAFERTMTQQIEQELNLEAAAEKRLVHFEPGVGLRDFALPMEDDGTFVPLEHDALLSYREKHEFLFPSCLHSERTGLYSESVLRKGRGGELAFACSHNGDFCKFFVLLRRLLGTKSKVLHQKYPVKAYLGSLSTMSALSSVPSTPEHKNNSQQVTPTYSLPRIEAMTPPALVPPPSSQPGSSRRGSAVKRKPEEGDEGSTGAVFKKTRGNEHREMQPVYLPSSKVPLTSPLAHTTSWRQQLILPSSTPKHSTRTIRRWPQAPSQPNSPASVASPVSAASSSAPGPSSVNEALVPLQLWRLKNIVQKKSPRLRFNPMWGTSLKGEGMTASVVHRLLHLCHDCNLYVRADMVHSHRTESCSAITKLPNLPALDDGHRALWTLLRICGLSSPQVQQLFQQCFICTRYIHPDYYALHKESCKAPSPILISDSDPDLSPTKRKIDRTIKALSPIVISDSEPEPSPTKTRVSKGKGKEKEVVQNDDDDSESVESEDDMGKFGSQLASLLSQG
ncbi:hypothetical protein F5880DRAFT_1506292 [Lentinula raphanica]|nr:hypothetical protein F5880DRAFT_1506292 [Lentinula raphanica]